MNIKVKKTYTLENVSHETMVEIVSGLECYQSHTGNGNIELLKELTEMIEPTKSIKCKAGSKINNCLKILKVLEALKPFEDSMVPHNIFPICSTRDTVCAFARGKAGQISISEWKNKSGFERAKKTDKHFFINGHCAELLGGFIKSDGDIGSSTYHVTAENEVQWRSDCYLSNKGFRCKDKKFLMVYNITSRELTINKEDVEITLNETERICLGEFISG